MFSIDPAQDQKLIYYVDCRKPPPAGRSSCSGSSICGDESLDEKVLPDDDTLCKFGMEPNTYRIGVAPTTSAPDLRRQDQKKGGLYTLRDLYNNPVMSGPSWTSNKPVQAPTNYDADSEESFKSSDWLVSRGSSSEAQLQDSGKSQPLTSPSTCSQRKPSASSGPKKALDATEASLLKLGNNGNGGFPNFLCGQNNVATTCNAANRIQAEYFTKIKELADLTFTMSSDFAKLLQLQFPLEDVPTARPLQASLRNRSTAFFMPYSKEEKMARDINKIRKKKLQQDVASFQEQWRSRNYSHCLLLDFYLGQWLEQNNVLQGAGGADKNRPEARGSLKCSVSAEKAEKSLRRTVGANRILRDMMALRTKRSEDEWERLFDGTRDYIDHNFVASTNERQVPILFTYDPKAQSFQPIEIFWRAEYNMRKRA